MLTSPACSPAAPPRDPLATAAGAAGGVIVSETLHHPAKKQAEKAYATGYDKGKSDAVKPQYWLRSAASPLPGPTAGTAD